MTERTTRSRIRFRPLFGLGLLLFAFTASVRGADDLPPNYYHDFRGRPLPAELTRFQVNDNLLQFEPQGLRITFPKTYGHPLGGVGVETGKAQGDFDITATVEVLSLEPPKGGPGMAVWTLRWTPRRSKSSSAAWLALKGQRCPFCAPVTFSRRKRKGL